MLSTFSFHENLPFIIELIGTMAFAMSGAFAAIQYKLDPFGVLIIAFSTAVGGGTIRDLLLGVPIFWMHDMIICSVIFLSAIASMIFKSLEKNYRNTLFIFDSLGLGMFTIIGVQKGMDFGLHPVICLTLGTITGCFGGVLRDILINRIPLLLRKEIYATACIIGGTIFIALVNFTEIPILLIHILTIIIIVLIRIIAVQYKLHIPKFYLN